MKPLGPYSNDNFPSYLLWFRAVIENPWKKNMSLGCLLSPPPIWPCQLLLWELTFSMQSPVSTPVPGGYFQESCFIVCHPQPVTCLSYFREPGHVFEPPGNPAPPTPGFSHLCVHTHFSGTLPGSSQKQASHLK